MRIDVRSGDRCEITDCRGDSDALLKFRERSLRQRTEILCLVTGGEGRVDVVAVGLVLVGVVLVAVTGGMYPPPPPEATITAGVAIVMLADAADEIFPAASITHA
jgi:hypothetical protein